MAVACVTGVETGRGDLGARWRKDSLLPRTRSRALNSLPLPLPFLTPATQARMTVVGVWPFTLSIGHRLRKTKEQKP